jgi:nitrite reductase (NADH) small subunit
MIRICSVEDVPVGEGRAVVVDGKRIAVFRAASGWYALDAVCPHRGGPLEDGLLADRTVICPLHERRFDLATGEALSDGPSVACYRVKASEDDVFLELEAAAPSLNSC